jgi:hypothetical protein
MHKPPVDCRTTLSGLNTDVYSLYKIFRFHVHGVARLKCSYIGWTLEGLDEARVQSRLPVFYCVLPTTSLTTTS